MKKLFISFMCIISLCVDHALWASTPYLNLRSQSANLALEGVGQNGYINRAPSEGKYTVISFTPAYFRSFRGDDLACCLFGPDLIKSGDCAQITISGSGRDDRNSNDWLADYFGLPTDFKSTVQFDPRIQNVLIDGNFYIGFDECICPGLYFRMHAPYVHTRWDLEFCERVCDSGETGYVEGYFGPSAVGTDKLLGSFTQFVVDCKTPDVSPTIDFDDDIPNPLVTPVEYKPLAFARFAGCECSPLTRNGLADLRFTLGYNPYVGDRYHIGFGLTGAAPTGNRPHGIYAFEPMIGNGNHWELGGQLTGHYEFWLSEDEQKSFTGYLDANLTHMFTARQTRTFDLKNKPNSRYMLAQKLGTPVYGLQVSNVLDVNTDEVPPAQFKDIFMPVANLSTVDVDVNIGAHIDMAVTLNYTSRNLSFDLGYNLWYRTCERIDLNCDCPTKLDDGKTWALKGDAHVYGFTAAAAGGVPMDTPYPLSATQSDASINKGTNVDVATTNIIAASNPGVDSAQYANARVQKTSGVIGTASYTALDNMTQGNDRDLILTSKDPIFLSNCDLDFAAAETKGLSHKVFGHFSYQWFSRENYIPFLGVGFSGEFVNGSADCCPKTTTDCKECDPSCVRCGLSQWGIWVKGGFSFE